MDQIQNDNPFYKQPSSTKKKVGFYVLIAVAVIAFWTLFIGAIVGGIMFLISFVQTGEEITFGDDSIPTVYKIVGERRITSTESSRTMTSHTRTITFGSGAISQNDINLYLTTLVESHNFIIINEDLDFYSGTLATESVDNGKVLLVEVNFQEFGYTVITYRKTSGDLSRHQSP